MNPPSPDNNAMNTNTNNTDNENLNNTIPRQLSANAVTEEGSKMNENVANNIQLLNNALHSNANLNTNPQQIVVNPVPIPGYEYVRNLGHGSFGVVNLCRAVNNNSSSPSNPNPEPNANENDSTLYVMKLVNLKDSPRNVCEGARAEVGSIDFEAFFFFLNMVSL